MSCLQSFFIIFCFFEVVISYLGDHQEKIFRSNYSCLVKIAEKYFKDKRINIFFDLSEEKDELIKAFGNWTVEIYDENFPSPETMLQRAKIMIMIIDTLQYTKISNALQKFRSNPTWNSRSKILIYSRGNEKIAKMILKKIWDIGRVANAIVAVKEDCLKFYTWAPYQKTDCSEVENIQILKFSELFVKTHLTNLNGCKIFVTTSALPPYVFDPDPGTYQYTKGVEVLVMKTIAEYFNGVPEYLYKVTSTGSNWISKGKNGTLAGALGMLARYEVDVGFSCLMLNYERYLHADFLVSHVEDDIVWFVPTPRPKIDINGMLFALDGFMWFAIFLTSTIAGIYLHYRENSRSALDTSMKILAAYFHFPVKTNIRLPIVLVYFAGLHTITSYSSWMSVNLMKETTEKPIKTLKEAVDANLLIYLLPSLVDYYNKTDFELWERILKPGQFAYNVYLYSRVDEIATKKSAVLLFARLPALYYIGKHHRDHNGIPKVEYIKPRFLPGKLTFYLSPGNPLTPYFNKKMMQIVESGLTSFWINSYVNSSVKITNEISYQEGNKPVTIKNIQAGFWYYITLIIISVFVFICEVIYGYVTRISCKKEKFMNMNGFPKTELIDSVIKNKICLK